MPPYDLTVLTGLIILGLLTVEDAGGSYVTLESLTGTGVSVQGHVVVTYNGETGSVCGKGNTQEDAMVICDQYGYSAGKVTTSTDVGSRRLMLGWPACVGTEEDVMECPGSVWRSYDPEDCASTLLSVKCYSPYYPRSPEGDVRLSNGTGPAAGRVEVSNGRGMWGTLCDDDWDDKDANVVCVQLGFTKGHADHMANIIQAGKTVWVSSIYCMGKEVHLNSCKAFQFSTSSACKHKRDAAVVCDKKKLPPFTPRIPNYHGAVSLLADGMWSSVCADQMEPYMLEEVGRIACRQMGLGRLLQALPGVRPHLSRIRYMRCSQDDHTLAHCEQIRVAPRNMVFNCETYLCLECGHSDGDKGMWISLGLRIGAPLLISGGCLLTGFCINLRQRKIRQRCTQQAAQARATAVNAPPSGMAVNPALDAPPPYNSGPAQQVPPLPPGTYIVPPGGWKAPGQWVMPAPPPSYAVAMAAQPSGAYGVAPTAYSMNSAQTPGMYSINPAPNPAAYGVNPAPASYGVNPALSGFTYGPGPAPQQQAYNVNPASGPGTVDSLNAGAAAPQVSSVNITATQVAYYHGASPLPSQRNAENPIAGAAPPGATCTPLPPVYDNKY